MISIFLGSGFMSRTFAQLEIPSSENFILNEDPNQVLNTQGIGDPIREGAYQVINAQDSNANDKIVGVVNNKISSSQQAQSQTLGLIKSIVNYALGLVSLVALIYLIYHGFIILTAA